MILAALFVGAGTIISAVTAAVADEGSLRCSALWSRWLLNMYLGAQIMTGVVIDSTSGEGAAEVVDWGQIWKLPCLGAMAILVVFVLLFREKKQAPAAA